MPRWAALLCSEGGVLRLSPPARTARAAAASPSLTLGDPAAPASARAPAPVTRGHRSGCHGFGSQVPHRPDCERPDTAETPFLRFSLLFSISLRLAGLAQGGSLSHFAPAPRELPGHPEALLQVPRVTIYCCYSHYRQLSIQAVLLLYGQGGVISFKLVISFHSLGVSKAWASEQRDSEGDAAEPGAVWGGFAPDACGWQIRPPGTPEDAIPAQRAAAGPAEGASRCTITSPCMSVQGAKLPADNSCTESLAWICIDEMISPAIHSAFLSAGFPAPLWNPGSTQRPFSWPGALCCALLCTDVPEQFHELLLYSH